MPKRAKPRRDKSGRFASAKSWAENIWTPMNARPFGYPFGGGEKAQPTAQDLVAAFADVVYSCIRLIGPAVARDVDRCKLVVRTGPRDDAPRSATRSLDHQVQKAIADRYPQMARRSADVREVTDHGLLDLLDQPNRHQSFRQVAELVVMYLDLVGSAFIHVPGVTVEGRKLPTGMFVLPAQLVTIETDQETGELAGYKVRHGDREVSYAAADVIHIRYPNPQDPYTSFGVSPVRAVWDRIQLLSKEQASWSAVLDNITFPSVLVHPPEGEMYTADQARLIESQLSEKGRWENNGGLWVVTEAMKLEAFSKPPKDLSALQLYETIRKSVATAFNIPAPMLDLAESGSKASDTIRRSFQQYCLSPRIDLILETISHHLCPPRMCLVADSVVQPDKVFQLQRIMGLVSSDVITINEARAAEGYAPRDGWDKLHAEVSELGTPSAQTFQTAAPPPVTKAQAGPGRPYRSRLPDPAPLEAALKGVFDQMGQEVLAGHTTKSFRPITDWAKELAGGITPVLRAYYDEGLGGIAAALGLDTSVPLVPVHRLADVVKGAAFALADSTLATTSLSVEEAVRRSREAVEQGLDAGEADAQLTGRLKGIFEDLSTRRARLIAESESSRAKHGGELMGIESAGVKARKVWLSDSMACDLCRPLNGKAVGLDQAFTKVGSGPYSRVDHPPAHPACRCTLMYDLGD